MVLAIVTWLFFQLMTIITNAGKLLGCCTSSEDIVVEMSQAPNVQIAWDRFWKAIQELKLSIRTSKEGHAVRLFMVTMLEVGRLPRILRPPTSSPLSLE